MTHNRIFRHSKFEQRLVGFHKYGTARYEQNQFKAVSSMPICCFKVSMGLSWSMASKAATCYPNHLHYVDHVEPQHCSFSAIVTAVRRIETQEYDVWWDDEWPHLLTFILRAFDTSREWKQGNTFVLFWTLSFFMSGFNTALLMSGMSQTQNSHLLTWCWQEEARPDILQPLYMELGPNCMLSAFRIW